MRLLIPVSVLLASALPSPSNFNDFLNELYSNCGGACASTEFKDSKFNCGDPSSSLSNACYCKNYVNIFTDLNATRFGTCISKCNLYISNIDYSKLANNIGDICGSSLGTDTTGTGASPSSTASSSANGGSISTATASSPSHTSAASTIASSKTALTLGALAILGYAL